jgi:hypothetical protein
MRQKNGRKLDHGLDREVWVSRFAAKFSREQPGIGLNLATGVARVLVPTLGILLPEDAVATYLSVQLDRHTLAGEVATKALSRLRKLK